MLFWLRVLGSEGLEVLCQIVQIGVDLSSRRDCGGGGGEVLMTVLRRMMGDTVNSQIDR